MSRPVEPVKPIRSTASSYQRILLKLSGEALMGKRPSGIESTVLQDIAEQLKEIQRLEIQVAVVIELLDINSKLIHGRLHDLHVDALILSDLLDRPLWSLGVCLGRTSGEGDIL